MHRFIRKNIVAAMVAALGLGLLALAGPIQADTHHNGHKAIQGKGNGKHHLHTSSHGHTAHAHVQNGKVNGVSVSHKGKSLSVKKVRSTKKLHALADVPEGMPFTLAETGDAMNFLATDTAPADGSRSSAQFTVWVGFAFYNQFTNQWIIFWFPVDVVYGGDAGAEEI
jgi:hypothetical protein